MFKGKTKPFKRTLGGKKGAVRLDLSTAPLYTGAFLDEVIDQLELDLDHQVGGLARPMWVSFSNENGIDRSFSTQSVRQKYE